MRLILFNKPFEVLPQFTAPRRSTLPARLRCRCQDVYPAGRLDYDSEGLMLLTDFGPWQARISQPGSALREALSGAGRGHRDEDALERLRRGVVLNDGPTRPAPSAGRSHEPTGSGRATRRSASARPIPTSWLEIELSEGRNRQVRRMTAAVGLPTLRLIRWAVGPGRREALRPASGARCRSRSRSRAAQEIADSCWNARGRGLHFPRLQECRQLPGRVPIRCRACASPRSASRVRGPARS